MKSARESCKPCAEGRIYPCPPISERTLVVLIGAGQLINTLDFTMVLPLGPDFAKALDIPVSSSALLHKASPRA